MKNYIVRENGTEIWAGNADSEADAISKAYDGVTDNNCGDLSLDDIKATATAELENYCPVCGQPGPGKYGTPFECETCIHGDNY